MPFPGRQSSRRRPHRRQAIITRLKLRLILMSLSLLPFTATPSTALQIMSKPLSPVYAAVGDSVTLACHFTLDPEDLGGIDIEWSTKPADVQKEERVVIWYARDHHIYNHFDPFRNRVQFVSQHPANGNASITINDLKTTDSDTYKCKVQKPPGIGNVIIRLHVMERPTKPVCHLEGVVEMGQKIVLKCKVEKGSPPVWYRWSSNDRMIPLSAMPDPLTGRLPLTINTEDVRGPYVCTAQNLVGSEMCNLTLAFKSTGNAVAISAATTVCVLLMIIIIAAILFCRRFARKEECGNEIRVDELPPHRRLPKKNQKAVSGTIGLKIKQVGYY